MEEITEILECFSRSFEEVSNQLKQTINLIRAEDKETASMILRSIQIAEPQFKAINIIRKHLEQS